MRQPTDNGVNLPEVARALQIALNGDSEFRLAARYWTGALQLEVGEATRVLRMRDGEVTGIEANSLAAGRPGEVMISASADDWGAFLEVVPRPFYDDFNPAMMHHGFELKGDAEYVWAYYAALRRVGQVMRAIAAKADP